MMYRIPQYTIALVRDGSLATDTRRLSRSEDARAVFRPLLEGLDREQFVVACLDAKHAVIWVNVCAVGSLSLAIVHPREVFKPAVLLNAAAIIVAHNHPSGDPEPSPEDRLLTHRLVVAGDVLGIAVLDHLILGDGRAYSFADAGTLKA